MIQVGEMDSQPEHLIYSYKRRGKIKYDVNKTEMVKEEKNTRLELIFLV